MLCCAPKEVRRQVLQQGCKLAHMDLGVLSLHMDTLWQQLPQEKAEEKRYS